MQYLEHHFFSRANKSNFFFQSAVIFCSVEYLSRFLDLYILSISLRPAHTTSSLDSNFQIIIIRCIIIILLIT